MAVGGRDVGPAGEKGGEERSGLREETSSSRCLSFLPPITRSQQKLGQAWLGQGPVIKRLLVGGALIRNTDIHQSRER